MAQRPTDSHGQGDAHEGPKGIGLAKRSKSPEMRIVKNAEMLRAGATKELVQTGHSLHAARQHNAENQPTGIAPCKKGQAQRDQEEYGHPFERLGQGAARSKRAGDSQCNSRHEHRYRDLNHAGRQPDLLPGRRAGDNPDHHHTE